MMRKSSMRVLVLAVMMSGPGLVSKTTAQEIGFAERFAPRELCHFHNSNIGSFPRKELFKTETAANTALL